MSGLEALISAHEAAMAKWRAADDAEWKEQGKEINALVGDTRQALFNHKPSNLAEVQRKAVFMAGDKAFNDWDDFDQMKLIEALTPAPEQPSTVMELFQQWKAAEERCCSPMHEDARAAMIDAELLPLEAQIEDTPSTSMQDLAAKVYVALQYDEGPFADEIDRLIAGGAA